MTTLRTGTAAAFLIGFGGWLAASLVRVESWWLIALVFVLGALTGMATPELLSLFSLWVGILASYPVALALGLFVSLGEGFGAALILFLVVAALGFGAAAARRRWRRKPSASW